MKEPVLRYGNVFRVEESNRRGGLSTSLSTELGGA
jgi:hypothetical protein